MLNFPAPPWLLRLDGTLWRHHRLRMAISTRNTETERAALIRAIAASGDRSAFIKLFEFYAPRIKAQALRFGLNADAAEDVVQDAMLAVWRRAGQFDPEKGSASAWVFSISANARIDLLRRTGRLASAEQIDAESPLLAVDAVEGGSADAARVERCMEDLPDDQRRIIQLSFFSHLPHGEIARRLGLPLGTVKSRVRLAIAKLRKALRDEA